MQYTTSVTPPSPQQRRAGGARTAHPRPGAAPSALLGRRAHPGAEPAREDHALHQARTLTTEPSWSKVNRTSGSPASTSARRERLTVAARRRAGTRRCPRRRACRRARRCFIAKSYQPSIVSLVIVPGALALAHPVLVHQARRTARSRPLSSTLRDLASGVLDEAQVVEHRGVAGLRTGALVLEHRRRPSARSR